MSAVLHHPARGRRNPILGAVLAIVALVAVPLLGTMPAHADGTGYDGTVVEGDPWGDGHLAPFLEGESYSDSLTAPFSYDDRTDRYSVSGDLPPGIETELKPDSTTVLLFSGTPTEPGEFSFTVEWYGSDGMTAAISFEVTVERSGSPTTTAIATAPYTPYDDIILIATVDAEPGFENLPTGTVEFRTDAATWGSSTVIGSAPLEADMTATFRWTGMNIASVGGNRGFIATYSGDAEYAGSTSTVATTLPYIPEADVTVLLNGEPWSDVPVRLLDIDDLGQVAASGTTGADGSTRLHPGAPADTFDVGREFLVEVGFGDDLRYYVFAETANVEDIDTADRVSRLNWRFPLTVNIAVLPVWTDTTLASMRIGSGYSDGVLAESPTDVTYTVSAGALPDGLSLNGATGAITGTPDCETEPCAYAFTIRAANAAGSITTDFSGTLLPAGVPPTWTDDVLPDDLQVSVAMSDGVVATGDPEITYSVTDGQLPPGLTLNTETGAVTGTPTTAGDYTFRITATNDYGSVDADFVRTVAEAPELALRLHFAAGTRIEDATTQISADGLKIGSTYTLDMFSSPVRLYTGIIGPTGGFSWTVSLPANTPPGAHSLVLTGIAPDGSTLTARAWFVLLPNGRIAAISYTGPLDALAYTGADPAAPLGLAGALLLLGAGALVVRRRFA